MGLTVLLRNKYTMLFGDADVAKQEALFYMAGDSPIRINVATGDFNQVRQVALTAVLVLVGRGINTVVDFALKQFFEDNHPRSDVDSFIQDLLYLEGVEPVLITSDGYLIKLKEDRHTGVRWAMPISDETGALVGTELPLLRKAVYTKANRAMDTEEIIKALRILGTEAIPLEFKVIVPTVLRRPIN